MGLFKRLFDFTFWLLPMYGTPEQQTLDLFPSYEVPSNTGLKTVQTGAQPCVNSPTTRNCWVDGFDINTDYEASDGIPPGKLVEYDLILRNEIIFPDGYLFEGITINGQYPGPTIEADWGDTIRVTVHNRLSNHNGTSIHWHGIRQFETNWEDGVPGITQCPIKPSTTQVYEFRATQYGTSWYHSHFSLQYPDGALGAIHINGPTSLNYDEELGPLLISDWYHKDTFSLFHQELSGGPPAPDSNILNGKGIFFCDPVTDNRCTGIQVREELQFQYNKTYKISIINTSTISQFIFWIDGHDFTIVQVDFVPIEPYTTPVFPGNKTNSINIGIGQRYDLIVTANASFTEGESFWIHGRACGNNNQVSTLGIIRYDPYDRRNPYTPPPGQEHETDVCADVNAASLVPIVPRIVGNPVNDMSPADYLKVGLESYPNISDPNSKLHNWVIANTSLYLDWEEPSLRLLAINDTPVKNFPPSLAPITLDFPTGDWVYFIITNNFTSANSPRLSLGVAHPIHLHGHDFVILAQGQGAFDPLTVVPNLNNPARRDVAMLPGGVTGGYLWIAFQVDNPGAWLMHCHIAFHASGGLALQFVEQPDKIAPLMQSAGIIPDFQDRCVGWTDYYTFVSEPNNATQEDSGI